MLLGRDHRKVQNGHRRRSMCLVFDVLLEPLNTFEDTGTEHADRLLVSTAHCMMYQVISVRFK